MNNKGELTDEVPGVVIAVIGILMIAGLVGLIIYNISVNQENENAKNILNVVYEHVDLIIKDGNEKKQITDGQFAVRGFDKAKIWAGLVGTWYLMGWGKNDASRPDKCAIDSCICICKRKSTYLQVTKPNPLNVDCQTNGYCRAVKADKFRISTLPEGNPTDGSDQVLYLDHPLQELDVTFVPSSKSSDGDAYLAIIKNGADYKT